MRTSIPCVCFAILTTALVGWTQSGPSAIHLANVDYAEGRLTGVRTISMESGSNHDPIWSPDGRAVAYVAEHPNEDRRSLVIRAADTGGLVRNLALPLGSFFPLVWSDNSLYGTGWTKQDGGGIYRVDAESGAATVVHRGTGHIRVSKDGKKVYFGRSLQDSGGMALIERDIAMGNEREVMRRQWFQGMALSPDNSYLITAGIDRATNSRTTLLVSLSSGEVRELQRAASENSPSDLTNWNKGARFWHAEWRSGSQSFLTRKRHNDERQDDEVWEVSLTGTARKLAFQFPRTALTYRLQPGGNMITWTTRQSPTTKVTPERP